MRQLATRFLLTFLAPVALCAQANEAPRPTENPLLWRIESNPPSYLYGTIHIPDERVVTMPSVVLEALEWCDVVVTELPMNKLGTSRTDILLPKGESLKGLLPEAIYARLEERLKKAGMPIRAFERFKIWAVTMTLAQLEFMDDLRAGKKPLDQVVWDTARDEGAEGEGLETAAEQLVAFDAFDVSEQIEMLRGTLDLGDEMEAKGESMLDGLIGLYLEGDAQRLMDGLDAYDPLRHRPDLASRFRKTLVEDRNVHMAERMIEKMAASPDKTFFFAVGAAHYPGETGILKLLEAEGVRVTRLPTMEDRISEILRRLRQIERRLDGLEKQRKAG